MTATDEQRARVADHIADLDYAGRASEVHAFQAVLADSERAATAYGVGGTTPVGDSLTMIAWALRLPLLRERLKALKSRPLTIPERDEVFRLDALIAEGERALGIQPPEAHDE